MSSIGVGGTRPFFKPDFLSWIFCAEFLNLFSKIENLI